MSPGMESAEIQHLASLSKLLLNAEEEARAKAQVQAWQGMVDSYTKMAADIHAQHKADAEARLAELQKAACCVWAFSVQPSAWV